jgi:uncharacterized membrane protein YbhN (UPF0104 family)
MNKKRTAIRITGVIAVLLSIIYVVRSLVFSGSLSGVRFSAWTIILLAILSSLYTAGNILRAAAWVMIIKGITSAKIPRRTIISVYLKTEIIKYIPSNIMHFAGRHIAIRDFGVTHKAALFSNVLDMGFILAAAAFVSAPSIIVFGTSMPDLMPKIIGNHMFIIVIAASVSIFAAVIFLIIAKRSIIRKLLSKRFIGMSGKVVLTDMIVVLLNGTLFCLLLKGLGITGGLSFPVCASLYALCWLAGFVVPGSPGGLGVREALIVIVFGRFYGEPSAALAAILMRIVSISGDAISLAAGLKITSK